VSGRLERAAAWFIVPAEAPGHVAAAPVPPAARVAVIGTAADVAPLAAAVALSLRAPSGLVALWADEPPPPGGLATRAAAKLAARLASRDLAAVARGRIAWMALPDDPDEAATAVRRASAAVDGPLVTALAGARPPALEQLVGEHDMAIVAADPGTALARAALAGLAARGLEAAACPPLRRGLGRRAALAGLSAPRLAPLAVRLDPRPARTEDR
jgi:hypothetical protein